MRLNKSVYTQRKHNIVEMKVLGFSEQTLEVALSGVAAMGHRLWPRGAGCRGRHNKVMKRDFLLG